MATTGHAPVDAAAKVVLNWLDLLREDLGWPPTAQPRAYLLLTETLHALRDCLTVDETADLAAQFPLIIRGIFYTGWNPAVTPRRPKSKAEFVNRIAARFSREPLDDPERAVIAVFDLLQHKVSAGELAHVSHAMRTPLQELWD